MITLTLLSTWDPLVSIRNSPLSTRLISSLLFLGAFLHLALSMELHHTQFITHSLRIALTQRRVIVVPKQREDNHVVVIPQYLGVLVDARLHSHRGEHVHIRNEEVCGGNALNRQVAQRVDGIEAVGVVQMRSVRQHVEGNGVARDRLGHVHSEHDSSQSSVFQNAIRQQFHLALLHEDGQTDGSFPSPQDEGQSVQSVQTQSEKRGMGLRHVNRQRGSSVTDIVDVYSSLQSETQTRLSPERLTQSTRRVHLKQEGLLAVGIGTPVLAVHEEMLLVLREVVHNAYTSLSRNWVTVSIPARSRHSTRIGVLGEHIEQCLLVDHCSQHRILRALPHGQF